MAVTCTCYTRQAGSAKTKSLISIIALVTQILVVGVHSSEMVSRPTGRRLPTWGVSPCPTMVVFVQQQGAQAPSQPNYAANHYIT